MKWKMDLVVPLIALRAVGVGAALTLAGCSSTPVSVDSVAQEGVSTRYESGNPVLQSSRVNDVSVTVLDANENALLLEIGLRNGGIDAFDVGPSNVSMAFDKPAGDQAAIGRVYTFEELAASGDRALAWDSANIVTGAVVPVAVGGGIAGSVLRGFIGLGMNEAERRSQSRNRPPAEAYLRRHTLEPGETHLGVLKIGFPHPPKAEQAVFLTVSTEADSHSFEYRIKR